MTRYKKICIICSKNYVARRISTVFCSKRCANKSRALPTRMLESLMKRSMDYTVIEDMGLPSYKASIQDIPLLLDQANAERKRRGLKPITSREFETGCLINDRQPLSSIARENEKYILQEDPANTPQGFGEKTEIQEPHDPEMATLKLPDVVNNNNSVNNNGNGIRKLGNGIRKIGGK